MTPERWQRIEELFEHGLEVAAGEREAWLAAACGADQDLHREVESLLRAHIESGGFLERPAVVQMESLGQVGQIDQSGRSGADSPTRARKWIGRRIGAYRVVDVLGEGGMSTVLLGARDDAEFQGHVAIKVLRGEPGPLALQRFERERQILADLDHPNIARLRDGGTLEEGLPYVVMDHVDGEPIDAYCDGRGLDVAARLALFLRVCDAVEAAHRSLIVHRDLKPANILVTAGGEPKLLDFGIAKPLDPGADQTVTRTVFRAMTPRYASPEQVLGERITTATDVYSLGVILFELLTGRAPYEISNLPLVAWQRVIAEVDPPRASQATESAAFARRLRGDLDTILQIVLHKDPRRRYGSVEAFADDIRRHLGNLPVRARPDTLRYRFGKLVRRNRTAAVLAASLFLLVAGFGAFTAVQARHLERERSKAEESLDFLVDVFRISDPTAGVASRPATDISAREILDLGAERVRSELGDRPEIQLTLLRSIGEAYVGLTAFDDAIEVFGQAADLSARLRGPEAPETLEIEVGLADALAGAGDFRSAEVLYRKVLESRRQTLGIGDPRTIEVLVQLTPEMGWSDQLPEAERMLRDAIGVVRRQAGSSRDKLGDLLAQLARVRQAQGDLPESESLFREALEIERQVYGESSDEVGETVDSLAILLLREGSYEEALARFREAEATFAPLREPDHDSRLAIQVGEAVALRNLGRYEEAESLLRHVLAVRKERFDRLNPKLLATIFNLGEVVADQERYEEAETLLREALNRALEAFGEGGRYVATARNSLGKCVRELGRLDEAEVLQRESLQAFRSLYGDDNPRTSRPLLELGRLALLRGDLDAAEAQGAAALEIRRRLLGPDHPEVREVEDFLAEVRSRASRSPAAAPKPFPPAASSR